MKKSKSSHFPNPPKDLDPLGIEAWDSVCADLDEIGTLENTDRKLIDLYSRDFALFKRIETILFATDTKLVLDCQNGRGFRHPLLDTYSKLSSKLQSDLNDLGLTPSARKAKARPKADDDPYQGIGGL